MKLTIIRHGETDHNVKEIIQGHTETELNENGRHQANLAGKLAEEKITQGEIPAFSRIICSPRLRAQQTAAIINKHLHLPIETWSEFNEINFGTFSNKTWDEAQEMAKNPNMKTEFRKMNFDLMPFQGESKEQVKNRIESALEKIHNTYPEEHVLIVTHAPIIRMVFHLLKGEQLSGIENAKMYEFEI